MNQILVICGPTATGKTALALKLARQFGGELISADSRQVYRGMDIGTGKDIAGVLGYDLVDPGTPFSLAEYRTFALQAIQATISRGHLPILVGGTGLYIKSIFFPPQTVTVKPNKELRTHLDGKSVTDLQLLLKTSNPERFNQMNHSDQQNPRRLIRAIEVGQSLPPLQSPVAFDVLWLGLTLPLRELDANITHRVRLRSTPAFTREIKALAQKYPGFSHLPAATATGYREWSAYLAGRLTRVQAIDLWSLHECQYARRQLTWFKKVKDLHWFDVSEPHWQLPVVDLVKTWYPKR